MKQQEIRPGQLWKEPDEQHHGNELYIILDKFRDYDGEEMWQIVYSGGGTISCSTDAILVDTLVSDCEEVS